MASNATAARVDDDVRERRTRIAKALLERAADQLDQVSHNTTGELRRELDDVLWLLFAAGDELEAVWP